MTIPDPTAVAIARQMPWTVAEPESIWLITGHINEKSTFVDCLAYALPHYVTAGDVVFVFIGATFGTRDFITPSMITSGQELILAYDNDPLTAHLVRDQDTIDRALEEAQR